jgi:hypothetical protein
VTATDARTAVENRRIVLRPERLLPFAAALLLIASAASGQPAPGGSVSVTSDLFPNRSNTGELRTRVFAEKVFQPTPAVLVTVSGSADGLVGRRPPGLAQPNATAADAVARVMDANISYRGSRFDLLAGFSRIAWGRLDELQPTDVINPLDVSRFFFESRSEARLPVALVRARAFLTEGTAIEAIYVPFFRRGRFDQLNESTSPFNIEAAFAPDTAACLAIGCPTVLPVVVERREPARIAGNAQGGARFSTTTGRVDWSVVAYRGFEAFGFGVAGISDLSAAFLPVDIVHPRFTMFGADLETVRGEWGVHGEVAAFVDDNFQRPSLRVVKGSSLDAGIGVDRKAGQYRVSATTLVHHEGYDEGLSSPPDVRGRSDVSLIVSADRTFARERYGVRTFAVYNANESSAFLRSIASAKIHDNFAIEGSTGWFIGDGRDIVGRFADSDFAYARVKYYF